MDYGSLFMFCKILGVEIETWIGNRDGECNFVLVRFHISWRGKQNISCEGMKTSHIISFLKP